MDLSRWSLTSTKKRVHTVFYNTGKKTSAHCSSTYRSFFTSSTFCLTLPCSAHIPPLPSAGHGQCNCGRCDCKEGWAGKKCEHPLSCSLSLESSVRKCRGTSNLPCFGRGTWSFPSHSLLPWLPQRGLYFVFTLSIYKRQFPAFLMS